MEMAGQSTAESMVRMMWDDDSEKRASSSENAQDGIDDDDHDQEPIKRSRSHYKRHTRHQIRELEAVFTVCQHPDDNLRKELGRKLRMSALQVKFWFQNKRTHTKAQQEKCENSQLRAEIEKLQAQVRDFMRSCANCQELSLREKQLMIENAQLREENDRLSGMAVEFARKSMVSYPPVPPVMPSFEPLSLGIGNFGEQQVLGGENFVAGELITRTTTIPRLPDIERPMVAELANTAMEELIGMAQLGEPLWVAGLDGIVEELNQEEYFQTFPNGIGPRSFGLKSEASRETVVVFMNPSYLVDMFMDVNLWSTNFTTVVSRAMILEVLQTGFANSYNGALHLMTAEFQVPSPLVPTREYYFARYCKHLEDGTWAVVDVSVDNLNPSPLLRCRRRPSGCLIEEMPNGYSKVTWVEHVEAFDQTVHDIYKGLVHSGLAFSAKKWVATLNRQCERIASSMDINNPAGDFSVLGGQDGRKCILKLADKMLTSFFNCVTSSTWRSSNSFPGSGAGDVRMMTSNNFDTSSGRPCGIILTAMTSFWLPVPPKTVFNFLRDINYRSEWDILTHGGIIQEISHSVTGGADGNFLSVLRVNGANYNHGKMFLLQECCTDSTGSYVIYSPTDIPVMAELVTGRDLQYVPVLPSGFAILPDGTTALQSDENGDQLGSTGSLLTVAFQFLINSVPAAKTPVGSVDTIRVLIGKAIDRIKTACLLGNIQ